MRARRCDQSFALAADVAEVLCQQHGLDYRSAYRVVGRAVRDDDLDRRRRYEAPRATCSTATSTSTPERLAEALDPERAIATRTVTGGAAPAPMDAMLDAAQAATDARPHAPRPAPGRARSRRARADQKAQVAVG